MIKLALLCGGANLLFSSCAPKSVTEERNLETLVTQQSDTLTLINSENGRKTYYLYTPLMERYELAQDPYMEFRYGLEIINYDSLGVETSRVVCDYAIMYENRELWEGRGNVHASSSDGKHLYTQQLFWDQKTDRIYSNVDSRVVDGEDEFIGDGFESDSGFEHWEFRNPVGRVMVNMEQSAEGDEEPEEDTFDREAAETAKAEAENSGRAVAPSDDQAAKRQTPRNNRNRNTLRPRMPREF